MSQKKDFLSQFSNDNKPDSFKEEERIKVVKERKPLNPLFIIIPLIILVIAGILVYFLMYRANIEVPNFVGENKNDVIAWVKQQEIETTGIIFKEEYDFDNDKDVIIEQIPEDGKVTKKAKMTFIVSKGADPDEKIKVPDFKEMSKDEISTWIKNNKLSATKLNTTFDDLIEKDEFIKAEYSGCEEDTFTRGCTLKISISKGPKPEDEIIMENYVGKTYAEIESWATSKKIKLTKYDAYSDYYDIGVVTYQSVAANEKVKAGDTIKVTVSKGKGTKVPDFTTMTSQQVDDWVSENGALVNVDGKYSESGAYVLDQSIATGKYIEDTKLKLTLNLGNTFYLSDVGMASQTSYDKAKDLAYELEEKGIYIDTHKLWVPSEHDEPRGTILGIEKINHGSNIYSEIQRLPLDVEVTYKVAIGNFEFNVEQFIGKEFSELKKWNADNAGYLLTILPADQDVTKKIVSVNELTSGTIKLAYEDTLTVVCEE